MHDYMRSFADKYPMDMPDLLKGLPSGRDGDSFLDQCVMKIC